jgi:hypothetical protein
MGELPKNELRDVLRTAAGEHQPDHDAMFARIAEQRNAPVRPVGPLTRLRPVAAILAVLTVAVLGGFGAWTAVKSVDRGGDDRVTVPPAAAERPTASVTPATSASAKSSPSLSPRTAASPTDRAPATVEIPSGSAPEEGFLWSDGSVAPESTDTQGRSNITLKNQRTLTAADVTIRIAVTDGLADAGAWSTMPAANYTATVHRESGALFYHFALNPGVTLVPGTYVFTAQYDHAEGGRDANDDAYLATATAGSSHVRVYGNFAPTH